MRAFLVVVVLVLVAGGGVAYWLNWWHVDSVPGKTEGETRVQLTLDKDKVKKDVDVAQDNLKEDVDKMKEGVHKKMKTSPQELVVEGSIRAIDPSRHTLTVRNDKDEEVAVKTDAATRIRIGDKEGALTDLKVGDAATVSYESTKEEKTAKSIAVKK